MRRRKHGAAVKRPSRLAVPKPDLAAFQARRSLAIGARRPTNRRRPTRARKVTSAGHSEWHEYEYPPTRPTERAITLGQSDQLDLRRYLRVDRPVQYSWPVPLATLRS